MSKERNGLDVHHEAAEELVNSGGLLNDLIVVFDFIDTTTGEDVA